MPRAALVLALLSVAAAPPAAAKAGAFDLTLSRLGLQRAGDPNCAPGSPGRCADVPRYQRLVAELALAVAPPMLLAPAETLGSRRFALALDAGFVSVDARDEAWRLGARGRRGQGPPGRMRWLRLGARKGLPGGLEVGANVATLTQSAYFVVGGELRLGLLEGFRRGPLGKLPDVALRGAINAFVGEADLRIVTPSLDLTFSKGLVLGREVVLTPLAGLQLLWTRSASEIVDLTPDVDALALCDPDPAGLAVGSLRCRGSGADLPSDVQFPGTRSFRLRGAAGVALRWRDVALRTAVDVDLRDPSASGDVPAGTRRQWRLDVGASFRY
ncbi:MAG: hypothetical protein AAF447_12260 [Myxococcota bacterium]